MQSGIVASENRATLARLTCNRAQPQYDVVALRDFLRDVHCPCVARRQHIWEYRTFSFNPPSTIDRTLFDPARLPDRVSAIAFDCPDDRALQFMSDVRWLDRTAHARFGAALPGDVGTAMVADVALLVGESASYEVSGDNGWTFLDKTGDAIPLGPVEYPAFAIFARARASEIAGFRTAMRELAERWADMAGVRRVRLSLLDPPEPKLNRHYQAMIELHMDNAMPIDGMIALADADMISALHIHPLLAQFSWCRDGRPTLAGLRGYAAARGIAAFNAVHQAEPALLDWMYGTFPVASAD